MARLRLLLLSCELATAAAWSSGASLRGASTCRAGAAALSGGPLFLEARGLVSGRAHAAGADRGRWRARLVLRQSPAPCAVRASAAGRSVGVGAGSGEGALIESGSTIADARKTGVQALRDSGVEDGEAESAIDILLEHVTKLSRGTLRSPSSRSRALSPEEAAHLEACVARRARSEPVQYIVGEWDFYNLRHILVRQPTLIPRPETEELVDMIVKHFGAASPPRFLEVGPGTGAISLALLKAWPGAQADAVELCKHAVNLTRDNARVFKLTDRLTTHHAGISEWAEMRGSRAELFPMLVSNPPYIPAPDMLGLDPEVRLFEDHVALDGGDDGLDVVWQILVAAPRLLVPGASIWLEVDESHPPLIAALFASASDAPRSGAVSARTDRSRQELAHIQLVSCHDDMFGRPRFVHLRVKDEEYGRLGAEAEGHDSTGTHGQS